MVTTRERGTLMPETNLLLFVTASLALIVVPGPDMIYVLARGISQGRAAGLVSVVGRRGLKLLTQDSWAPKIVYKGFSTGHERGFVWGVFCGMRDGGRGLLVFWSGCAL